MAATDDWRRKCKNINGTFTQARKKALFVDVRFLVGQPSSAKFFSAHKMILACGSPVFEAMLFGPLAESKDPIAIPDDEPEAFEIMLQHLYDECFILPSIIEACKLFSIADKYLITQLQTKSADFIKNFTMKEEDFWEIIEGSHLTFSCIEKKFRSYIELQANELIASEKFLHVPEYVINIFLLMETMNASEFELLSSVTKWCLKNFSQDTMSKTQDMLQYVRFSVLTSTEFCLFTENFPDALDSSTSLMILKHLNDPPRYHLPVWCSTSKDVRKPKPTIYPQPATIQMTTQVAGLGTSDAPQNYWSIDPPTCRTAS